MQELYDAIDDGIERRAELVEGFGHQDMLIGKDAAREVFPKIESFLSRYGEP
jgi:hypothetical protein